MSRSNFKPNFTNFTNFKGWIEIAELHSEKCELKEAKEVYLMALQEAKKAKDRKERVEALAGLLRLAGEALDEASIEKWDQEIDLCILERPRQMPPMTWYCKGAVARHRCQYLLAQRFFHRYLRAVRRDSTRPDSIVRGWVMLAVLLLQRNRLRRSLWLATEILARYESQSLKGINGMVYLLMGTLHERQGDYKKALSWLQKAQREFLGEHNWYYHLYTLYGYARIARYQMHYSQASRYLDWVDQAVGASEFGLLRREIATERSRLAQEAIDLFIDSRQCIINTREKRDISLGKQYVLLQILEALSTAHNRSGIDKRRGLSKAEIIEYVWKEVYCGEVHDSKLYYNINRLRKLIEPNVRKPQYLLNWQEGYRLAPSLKIHFVGVFGRN